MAIQHQITICALSAESKTQHKHRVFISAGMVLLFSIISYYNNPFQEYGLSKLQIAIGSISTGYAIQTISFIVFNIIALLGDRSVQNENEYNKTHSPLAGIHFIASLFMMFGFVGASYSPFEQDYYVLGLMGIALNVSAWLYIFKTTK